MSIYWLNDDSRLFLSRGYLPEGMTPEQRIRDIAEAAAGYLEDESFADRFEDYMHRGWISLASPVWANFGTNRGLPISCVTGDTWINTPDGGKAAQDIEVGDLVLTHQGRFRPVTKIVKTENRGDIYHLKVCTRMTKIRLTGNHPVLTNLGWVRVDELDPIKHLVAVNGRLESTELPYTIDLEPYCDRDTEVRDGRLVKQLSAGNQEKLQSSDNSYCARPYKSVEVSEDLAWALGLWFAEGSITTGSDKRPNGIRITMNLSERRIVERWLQIVQDAFGVNGGVYEGGRYAKKTWVNANLNSRVVGAFFASFGNGCREKTIPCWALDLPRKHQACMLDGLLAGDAHFRKDGTWKLTLANPKLLLQAYLLALKLDKPVSLQMQDKPSHWGKTKHVYTMVGLREYGLSRSRAKADAGIPFTDGLVYVPIRSLVRTEEHDDVFDFTVEEDHSFSAAGVILHNCNGSYIEDTIESILVKTAEIGMMTKQGAGTSAYLGALRSRNTKVSAGGVSSGPIHFAELIEATTSVISQSSVRRGSCAIYLDIEHPDVEELLMCREEGHPVQHLSLGICVGDAWLKSMIDGDSEKRKTWLRVIKKRFETGYPYIIFTDNAARGRPQAYADQGMEIFASNLCTEIFLPSSVDESFVCCLSSLNLIHYDDWKDTDLVETMTMFLDAVMEEYIQKTANMPLMEAAHRFAKRHRAIGLGVLGWHSYLQSKMIPFESDEAKAINIEIFRLMDEASREASAALAERFGEPEVMVGYNQRNATRLANAPTTSSSFILGQASPSTEVQDSNYYVKSLQKGRFTYRNPYLQTLLAGYGKDTDEVWRSILYAGGSVQHLDFLTDREKGVFKTFDEVDQMVIVDQAADRQVYIDQGQSLNLKIHPEASTKDVNRILLHGWKRGLKSFYYQRSMNLAQEAVRKQLACAACEA